MQECTETLLCCRVLMTTENLADLTGQYTVTLDVHATYREYTVVATGQKTKKSRVLVSSDMCQDNSVINIILSDATGKYETECEPRKKPGDGSQFLNGRQTGGKFSGLVNFLKNLGK